MFPPSGFMFHFYPFVDAGTISFSPATYSSPERDAGVRIPVLRSNGLHRVLTVTLTRTGRARGSQHVTVVYTPHNGTALTGVRPLPSAVLALGDNDFYATQGVASFPGKNFVLDAAPPKTR